KIIQSRYSNTQDTALPDTGFYRKRIVADDVLCTVDVLDIADHENTALQEHIRNSDGVILAYSIANRRSFKCIQDYHAQIQRVKNSHLLPMILAGTSCEQLKEQKVSIAEASKLATTTLRCNILEVSASKAINIDPIFHHIVKEIRQ
ncbi:hypothetical protein K432DRAFT_258523, partial [Lepidopterella palustris CBS 459.81]